MKQQRWEEELNGLELNLEKTPMEILINFIAKQIKKARRQGYEKAVRVREIRDKIRNGK
ncbi:MAG: hypothetical protein PHS93_10050 [Candidatus Omnitrophica bacterium]|nr:hypothetical protein [Candidatus Omnitrophota bacterium]